MTPLEVHRLLAQLPEGYSVTRVHFWNDDAGDWFAWIKTPAGKSVLYDHRNCKVRVFKPGPARWRCYSSDEIIAYITDVI